MTELDMAGLFDHAEEPPPQKRNRLFYGDNLTIMRSMPTACVDLIYLDPPFNSQRTYNLIYKQLTGAPVPEQEEAFCDAWELDPEKEELARNMPVELEKYGVPDDVRQFWKAWINALRSTQPRLLAYLVYMTYRLFEMRRILKPTGSIYLHCDPTASHYIKVMMDGVFGHGNFRNEIIWKRTNAHNFRSRFWHREHDTILVYSRGNSFTLNPVYQPYGPEQLKRYRKDETGRLYTGQDLTVSAVRPRRQFEWRGTKPPAHRSWGASLEQLEEWYAQGRILLKRDGTPRLDGLKVYLDETKGKAVGSVWTDIPRISNTSAERLGYPTQKPLALLERIIRASTNEGDVVFDPFCGCGTAIYAAHLNNRRWIGCDIAILSVTIVRDVLAKRYGLEEGEHYEISGVPLSLEGAQHLMDHDPRQFQHWVVELAGGFCNSRYSADRGIDGRIYFETRDGLRSMVLSVKGGQVAPAHIRELRGTLEREGGAEMAGFICMRPPTRGMVQEAARAGAYTYLGRQYPRIQIRTVEELLSGRSFDTPSRVETLSWDRHQTKLAL